MTNLSGKMGVSLIDDSKPSPDRTFSSEFISSIAQRDNLLDNWDFRGASPDPLLNAVVNQRGQTAYTQGRAIDRWVVGSQTKMSLMDGFVRIERNSGTSAHSSAQFIEFPHLHAGKTLTFSALYRTSIDSFRLRSGTNHGNMTDATIERAGNWTLLARTFNVHETIESLFVAIRMGQGAPVGGHIDIQAVKLELGTVSTLANDPPMDFGRELAVCQRHQVVNRSGTWELIRASHVNPDVIRFVVPVTTRMRIRPIISGGHVAVTRVNDINTAIEGFAFSAHFSVIGGMQIAAFKIGHGLADAVLRMFGTRDNQLIFDANL